MGPQLCECGQPAAARSIRCFDCRRKRHLTQMRDWQIRRRRELGLPDPVKRKLGPPRPPSPVRTEVTVRCRQCDQEFIYTRKPGRGRDRRYCSTPCSDLWGQIHRPPSPPRFITKTCTECGSSFITQNHKQPTCGTVCGRARQIRSGTGWPIQQKRWPTPSDKARHNNAARRTRVEGSETFPASDIFRRDNWTCGICGKRVDPALRWPDRMSASLDHIIALADGGTHTRANSQCSHLGCNSRKWIRRRKSLLDVPVSVEDRPGSVFRA